MAIPVTGVDDALASLPADVDAVFLALPLFLPPGEMHELAQGLIDRGLPSFRRREPARWRRGCWSACTPIPIWNGWGGASL